MERVGDVLKSILDPRITESAEIWHRFFSSWEGLVGPDLACLARLVEVERGEAVVHVDHPAAAQLLALRKELVLARIRSEHPAAGVRGLRILVRPRGPEGTTGAAGAR